MSKIYKIQTVLLIIVFSLSSIVSFAQDGANDLDKKYQPQNLSSSESGKSSSGSKSDIYPNIIKVNAGMILRSIGSVSYERAITKHFGLEVGTGLVFGMDVFQSISYQLDLFETSTTNNYINFALNDANTDNSEVGNVFLINPKYYFDGEGLSGVYVSLGYRHVKNNFATPVTYRQITADGLGGYNYNDVKKNIPNRLSNNNYNFIVGNTFQASHFVFEIYAGLGARTTNLYKMEYTLMPSNGGGIGYETKTTSYETYQNYQYNSGYGYATNIRASKEKISFISMTMMIGISFGIAF